MEVKVGQVWESVRNKKLVRVLEVHGIDGTPCVHVEILDKGHIDLKGFLGGRFWKWLSVGAEGIKGYRLYAP